MTIYRAWILIILSVILSACGEKATFTNSGANFFGEQISEEGAIMLNEVSPPSNPSDTTEVVVEAIINEVCQAKGCWMTLTNSSSDESIFVRFKDYAFFVPKDAGGKKAVVKGKLFSTITSVDELRHYAEDKGKSAEEIAAITEPKKELRMMADGVIIYND